MLMQSSQSLLQQYNEWQQQQPREIGRKVISDLFCLSACYHKVMLSQDTEALRGSLQFCSNDF